MRRRRIRPLRAGEGCQLSLSPDERLLLENLPAELAGVLSGLNVTGRVPDGLQRLFPPAYLRDDEAEASYVDTTRGELAASHRTALETLARTARATRLDREQMGEWMTALNDLRLVLGTALDVTDDESWLPEGPPSSEVMIYHYLTLLQAELIDVMEQWLPAPSPGADELVPDDPWGSPLGGLRWDGTPEPGDGEGEP